MDNNNLLPFHTDRKISIYGGHESWLREIKPLLPDVKFISRFRNPTAESVRNAGEIWFQSNAISHSNYYKVLLTARKAGIEVHYFDCASAKKCAIKLAEQYTNESGGA